MSTKQITKNLRSNVAERFRPGGIGRHISWLLAHSGIEAATMTVAALVATKWFGPAKFGQLALLLTGVQLIANLGDGLSNTLVKVISDARNKANVNAAALAWRYIWITLAIIICLSLVMGTFLVAVFGDSLTVRWIMLAVGLAIARTWRSAFDGVYRGIREFRVPAIAGIVCTMFMSGSIIALTLYGFGVGSYITVMAVGSAVNCFWLLSAFKGVADYKINPGEGQARSTEFFRYCIPLTLRAGLAFLFIKVNVWILGWLETDTQMAGQFRLTDQFLTIPALVLSAVLAAVAPRISEAQAKGIEVLSGLVVKVYGFMLLLTFPMALALLLNGPIMQWLFPDYMWASRMLVYFAPSMLVMGLGYTASIALIQGGRPGAAFLITLAAGIANVLAAWLGHRAGGVMGLAAGTAAVHFCTYLLNCVAAHKLLGLRLMPAT